MVFFENRVVDYAKGALTGDWADVWGSVNTTGRTKDE